MESIPEPSSVVPFMVGVGASAGGLEALAQLLSEAEGRGDIAYIIVQHLSPDYKSMIAELLERNTRISVRRAQDGQTVIGGAAYVIEPQTTLTVSGAKLVVRPQERGSQIHLPVDILFQSLARDQGANAAGVILSGTGSDGTRGCRVIKELGGLVIAQNAESAAFDGMPRSIRTAGLADLVLPPSAIPREIGRILDNGGLARDNLPDDERRVVFNRVLTILRRDEALNFGHYKASTIVRRVNRRIGVLGLSPSAYADRLEQEPGERALLVKDMLIGVTRFFRDPEAFESLALQVRAYLESLPPEVAFRGWVAGCSTGEEAYSVALLVAEAIRQTDPSRAFKLFATDVNQDSLKIASAGTYTASAAADVPPQYLARYFERSSNGTFTVRQSLRDHILFSRHNVFQDPPFSGLGLVVCRNLLIYLRSSVQARVCANFAFSLVKGGIAFFGPSESPANQQQDFELLDPHWQIFRACGGRRLSEGLSLPTNAGRASDPVLPIPGMRRDLELLDVFRRLSGLYVPPFVVIDAGFQLIYRSGDLGGLLSVPDGRATLDCRQMFPAELTAILLNLMAQLQQHPLIRLEPIRIREHEHEFAFEVRAQRIEESALGRSLYLLVFEGLKETSAAPREVVLAGVGLSVEERLRDLEQQLAASKENLQATVEALESSNEELQATNEELLASNEELQSLNEELQSVNEELHTINSEHQVKIEELSRLNTDMDQLLSSIDIGAVFVDHELRIRRFNAPAASFVNLIAQDVGRPLGHLSHCFGDAPLLGLCEKALLESEPVDRLLVTTTGCRVLFHARALPKDSGERGLVITFADVTSVHTERESRHLLDEALQWAEVPLAMLDQNGVITLANRAFAAQFDRDAKWLPGLDVRLLLSEEERGGFKSTLERIAAGETWYGVVHSLKADGSIFQELVRLSPLRNEAGETVGVLRLTEGAFALGTIPGATLTGTYTWDIRTDETRCSLSLYDVLGMPPDGPVPSMQSFYPLILSEDRGSVDRNLAQGVDSFQPHEFSFRARRQTGEIQRVGCRMLPDRLPTGELKRIIGVMWVIHEQEQGQRLGLPS